MPTTDAPATELDLAVQIAGGSWRVSTHSDRYVQFSRAGVTIAAEFLSRRRGAAFVGNLLKATLHVRSSRITFDGQRGRRIVATDNAHQLFSWLSEPLPPTPPMVQPLTPAASTPPTKPSARCSPIPAPESAAQERAK